MLEFGCGLPVIQAIDLAMEWRINWAKGRQLNASGVASAWYRGFLGTSNHDVPIFGPPIGTFTWPYFEKTRRKYQ
jgi:hypothetical protein